MIKIFQPKIISFTHYMVLSVKSTSVIILAR